MKRLAVIGGLLALLLVGCGETGGASQQEMRDAKNRAYTQGERSGLTKARAAAEVREERLRTARNQSYWQGWEEGYDEGEESALELSPEEVEELREEFGIDPEYEARNGYINPEPLNQYGEPSQEFEPDDIERAEEADQELREYCEGAVSEAQEVGCLSHAEP